MFHTPPSANCDRWELEKAGWVIDLLTNLQQVSDLIGADPREIVFTSGATESNNIAVKGVARFYKSKKKHVITTQTVRSAVCVCVIERDIERDVCHGVMMLRKRKNRETEQLKTTPRKHLRLCRRLLQVCDQHVLLQEHKCVLDSCRQLEAEGFTVTYLPVGTNGLVSVKVCSADEAFYHAMHVNHLTDNWRPQFAQNLFRSRHTDSGVV